MSRATHKAPPQNKLLDLAARCALKRELQRLLAGRPRLEERRGGAVRNGLTHTALVCEHEVEAK